MLWDNPPHRITLLSVASGVDAGGGTSLVYTSVQSAVPASINTASASEVEMFSQQGMQVSHTIAVLASALTTVPLRGWKATSDDRSESFHIEGIRHGRSYGGIPAFVYLQVRQIL